VTASYAEILEIATPLIADGLAPGMVRARVYCETGTLIGPGGHSDPCQPPVCPICGACGPGGGHGWMCPYGAARQAELAAAQDGEAP
jgi:hypothetical protein